MTGFEPATPTSRTLCATKLRYIPLFLLYTETVVSAGVPPLSQKRYLIVFVRQSATSRYFYYTPKLSFRRVRYPSPRRILNPSRRQSATSRGVNIATTGCNTYHLFIFIITQQKILLHYLFYTFCQKGFDFFALNLACCRSWKGLCSYNYIYRSFVRCKLM